MNSLLITYISKGDSVIKFWNLNTGVYLFDLNEHTSNIVNIHLFIDSYKNYNHTSLLASLTENGELIYWNYL